MPETSKYLNLGCGSRYHSDWINIDIAPQGPEVVYNDLNIGIKLPGTSCEVVYHAAVLEHLRRSDAVVFLGECHRVLKPGGILRVGVPDLEKICKLYLAKLEASLNEENSAADDYDWIMLELFDQIVREKSGGGMLDYLRRESLPNETFIYERIGEEGRELVKQLRSDSKGSERHQHQLPLLFYKLKRGFRTLPCLLKRCILFWMLGAEDKQAIEIGRFRMAGEVHQWMYDRYSLARLLKLTGFCDPQLYDAHNSLIPNWTSFHLDTLPNGQVVKPDLFFMEAIKPREPNHD